MTLILNSKTKIVFTLTVILFVAGILLLEHLRGGIVSHHLLARKDMPKISNWWGLVSVPLMTWILLSLIQKNHLKSSNISESLSKKVINGVVGAALFGITVSLLFYYAPALPGYFILMTFVVALFIPLYQPQYYLGFILSMAYGFGGILPILFGLVLLPIYWIEYALIRRAFLYLLNTMK